MTDVMPHQKNAGRPARRERDEVFLEVTRSICPICKVTIDAEVNVREDKVYLRKRCREHGQFEALIYGDAQMYLDSVRFNKPGTIPLAFQTEVVEGCPSDCGLCPDHKQHACLGIIEVNTGCNLDCPICFADSGHQSDGVLDHRPAVRADAGRVRRRRGRARGGHVLRGEPTIHREILTFVDLAQARPIKVVTLNTNGIRLASDRRFVVARNVGSNHQRRKPSAQVRRPFRRPDAVQIAT